jgi:hypothetical protein
MSEPLGETIRSDSQSIEVECHQLYRAPRFGSFIRADCPSGFTQYGVVFHTATGPFDSSRIVHAHRLAPGELEERKPHLTTILRTLFQARLVGYGQGDAVVSGTPPSPARLHCFVYPAPEDAVQRLTSSPAFLRALVQTPDAPTEDLLVAAIEEARSAWGSDEKLIYWGKYLARLLHQDYLTLEGVLQRLSPPAALPSSSRSLNGAAGWEKPLPLVGRAAAAEVDPFEGV